MSGIHFNQPMKSTPLPSKIHAKKTTPKIQETKTHHEEIKSNHLEKPTPHNKEILHHPPTLYFFEINTSHDLEKFKLTLIAPSIKPILPTTSFNLTAFGIDREIPVIGNRFIPLKRTEHQEIHRAILEHGHHVGITHPERLTFIVIDDNLWDTAIHELSHHITIHQEPMMLKSKPKESDGIERESHRRPHHKEELKHVKKTSKKVEHSSNAKIAKALAKLHTQEIHRKEHAKEKQIIKQLEEEAFIKYGIAQHEALLARIQTEAQKGTISFKILEKLTHQWAHSLPPFPIRSVNGSIIWKELKTKMIEELTKDLRSLT